MIKLKQKECKQCNKQSGWVRMGKFPKGKIYRYVNENGQYWNGKVCPECNLIRIKNKMKELRNGNIDNLL
jgi:hypothetical protein